MENLGKILETRYYTCECCTGKVMQNTVEISVQTLLLEFRMTLYLMH